MRIDLAYDGAPFHGWARQPGRRTVQGELEAALAILCKVEVRTVVAGRTDTGVHARGQVVHADLPEAAELPSTRKLNGLLDPAIRIRDVRWASPGFDVRFAALWRRYLYRVGDSVVDPLRRHDTLSWPRPLDVTRLEAASTMLLGEHDFAAFCRRREGATTIRSLLALDWRRDDAGVCEATVVADAFCHGMVRSLVGTLLVVGDGRRPPDWPAELLASCSREGAASVAPPYGLTLVEVGYPPDAGLAARVEVTRRRRV